MAMDECAKGDDAERLCMSPLGHYERALRLEKMALDMLPCSDGAAKAREIFTESISAIEANINALRCEYVASRYAVRIPFEIFIKLERWLDRQEITPPFYSKIMNEMHQAVPGVFDVTRYRPDVSILFTLRIEDDTPVNRAKLIMVIDKNIKEAQDFFSTHPAQN